MSSSPPEPSIRRESPAVGSIFLDDELLEDIFLRLASPADLVRASIACASFRRVVADRSFLRRCRSLHKPLFLGLLREDFHPAEPPHPSAPTAAALAQAADFAFSFLPPGGFWRPRDCRDGRVLLARLPVRREARDEGSKLIPVDYKNVMTDHAVCDPISRRYVILPPIPLLTGLKIFETFLLAPAAEEEVADTSFRGMAKVHLNSQTREYGMQL